MTVMATALVAAIAAALILGGIAFAEFRRANHLEILNLGLSSNLKEYTSRRYALVAPTHRDARAWIERHAHPPRNFYVVTRPDELRGLAVHEVAWMPNWAQCMNDRTAQQMVEQAGYAERMSR